MQIFDHDQTQDVQAIAIEKSNSFKEEAFEPDVKIEKDEEASDKRYIQLLKLYVTSFIKDNSAKVTIASDGNDTENSSFVVINSELEKEVKIQFSDKNEYEVTVQVKLSETQIANQNIAALVAGGEKRCCLPQILNRVLDQISLPSIYAAFDELQIDLYTCTPEQLDIFKKAKIIPNTANSCDLITKSDAERLCSRLLENLSETQIVCQIANQSIAAFDVGGKKWCCLPQILTGVFC